MTLGIIFIIYIINNIYHIFKNKISCISMIRNIFFLSSVSSSIFLFHKAVLYISKFKEIYGIFKYISGNIVYSIINMSILF